MTLRQLIAKLSKEKLRHHGEEVEFIICRKKDGNIIAMDLQANAQDIMRILELFGS